jgi:hypothetical protein
MRETLHEFDKIHEMEQLAVSAMYFALTVQVALSQCCSLELMFTVT